MNKFISQILKETKKKSMHEHFSSDIITII
jgi:hypothetical protein